MAASAEARCTTVPPSGLPVHREQKRQAQAFHPFRVAFSGGASLTSPARVRHGAADAPHRRCSRRNPGSVQCLGRTGGKDVLRDPHPLRRPPTFLLAFFALAAAAMLARLQLHREHFGSVAPSGLPAAGPLPAPARGEAVRVSGAGGAADVPLSALHFEAFRRLVGVQFEVRRGPGPNGVRFRPRLAMTTTPWPYKSWTRARLVSSLAKPRFGRQAFSATSMCEERDGSETAPYKGQVLILAAFEQQYSSDELGHAGQWWLKDNSICNTHGRAFHLALREAQPAARVAATLRQRLWQAVADEVRYPKVP
mmetsp:Transcript_70191/g.221686  ORF Transcript_70191/g.221686 Transcript_70191/m.221686 type:complete len:309 (+) Transcript_70191:69-995(+)